MNSLSFSRCLTRISKRCEEFHDNVIEFYHNMGFLSAAGRLVYFCQLSDHIGMTSK